MTAQKWTENNGGWWGAVWTGCDWLKEHTATAAALPPPGSRLKTNTPWKWSQIPGEVCHVTWGERCSAWSIRLAAAAARGPSDSVAPQRSTAEAFWCLILHFLPLHPLVWKLDLSPLPIPNHFQPFYSDGRQIGKKRKGRTEHKKSIKPANQFHKTLAPSHHSPKYQSCFHVFIWHWISSFLHWTTT